MSDFFNSAKDMVSGTSDITQASPKKTLIIVILSIIVIAGIVFWYFRPKARDVTIMGPYELRGRSDKSVLNPWISLMDADQIISTTGNNITCSFFVYMNDVNRERIPIGNTVDDFKYQYLAIVGNSIGVMLDPIHQKAKVTIVPMPVSGTTFKWSDIEINDVMIAKWNQITITVEGRTVDIYLNGILATSTLLDNVPFMQFSGMMLNTSPDFSGQAGLIQVWPERRTTKQILENYKRNTDTRGKPLIPDKGFTFRDAWNRLTRSICKTTGFCGLRVEVAPMQYVEYDFA